MKFWTDERVEKLREMRKAGIQTAVIAEALGITRSAVLGKAHRLDAAIGLPPRPDMPAPMAPCASRFETHEREVVSRQCKWPIGTPGAPGFHFCEARMGRREPYCDAHAERAFLPPDQRPKSGNNLARTLRRYL